MDYEALKPEPISLVETVKELRNQRHPWMVEGESQYTFAYVVILHLLKELACQSPSKNESLLQALLSTLIMFYKQHCKKEISLSFSKFHSRCLI